MLLIDLCKWNFWTFMVLLQLIKGYLHQKMTIMIIISIKKWWLLAHEVECIFKYLLDGKAYLVMRIDQIIDEVTNNISKNLSA